MISLDQHPAAGFHAERPSLAVATLGFVGSTLVTATLMVLLSAL